MDRGYSSHADKVSYFATFGTYIIRRDDIGNLGRGACDEEQEGRVHVGGKGEIKRGTGRKGRRVIAERADEWWMNGEETK